jgi:hypothetical protein
VADRPGHSRDERGFGASSVAAVASDAVVAAGLVGFVLGNDSGAQAGPPPSTQTTVAGQNTAPTQTGSPPPQRPKAKSHDQRPSKRPTREKPTREKPTKGPTREQPPPVPDVFVEVYNNGGGYGLAASTAGRLQAAGWQVVATDNWYGDIPSSTVYFPSSLQREAEQLARSLGIARTWPAVAPMRFDRLTVILTSDYSG